MVDAAFDQPLVTRSVKDGILSSWLFLLEWSGMISKQCRGGLIAIETQHPYQRGLNIRVQNFDYTCQYKYLITITTNPYTATAYGKLSLAHSALQEVQ